MKLQFSDVSHEVAQDSDCWKRGNEGAIWLPQPTAWRGFQATVQVGEPCGAWLYPWVEEELGLQEIQDE